MGLIFCSFTFCVGVCISQELAAPWVWAQHGPLWGGRAGHCPSHKPSREQDSGGQLGHPQLWALGTSVVWAEAKLRHQPMGEGQLDCSGVLRLGRVGRTHPINALMSLAVDTDWKRKKKKHYDPDLAACVRSTHMEITIFSTRVTKIYWIPYGSLLLSPCCGIHWAAGPTLALQDLLSFSLLMRTIYVVECLDLQNLSLNSVFKMYKLLCVVKM